jgi:cyclase
MGKPQIYSSAKGGTVTSDWVERTKKLVSAGAGEVLLISIDKDGTMQGPDLVLIEELSQAIEVPLIAVGGVGSLDDIKAAVDAGASAVAAGAFFVYNGKHRAVLMTYPKYKDLEKLFNQNEFGIRSKDE